VPFRCFPLPKGAGADAKRAQVPAAARAQQMHGEVYKVPACRCKRAPRVHGGLHAACSQQLDWQGARARADIAASAPPALRAWLAEPHDAAARAAAPGPDAARAAAGRRRRSTPRWRSWAWTSSCWRATCRCPRIAQPYPTYSIPPRLPAAPPALLRPPLTAGAPAIAAARRPCSRGSPPCAQAGAPARA